MYEAFHSRDSIWITIRQVSQAILGNAVRRDLNATPALYIRFLFVVPRTLLSFLTLGDSLPRSCGDERPQARSMQASSRPMSPVRRPSTMMWLPRQVHATTRIALQTQRMRCIRPIICTGIMPRASLPSQRTVATVPRRSSAGGVSMRAGVLFAGYVTV